MPFHKLTLNFNAGELSPFLISRTDVGKYESGCQRLENFIILPYGGVIRRPGTQYLGKAKFQDKPCRLIGFNFSVTTNFILEFGEKYVRFWTNAIQVTKPTASVSVWVTAHAYKVGDYVTQTSVMYYCTTAHTSGTFATDLAAGKWVQQNILEVPTPYLASEVRDIQYCQINDLMYLTHPDHPPAKLTRKADDDWTYAEIAWSGTQGWPPTLDENIENITLDPSASTGNITVVASADLFKPEHVGSVWVYGLRRSGGNQSYVEVPLDATSHTSSGLYVLGSWEFVTYGSWVGEVNVQRNINGSWEPLRTYKSSVIGERNVSTTGIEDKPCNLRIVWTTAGQAGTSSPNSRLSVGDSRQYGSFKITGYTNPRSVSATVIATLPSVAPSTLWSEAAFSTYQGFPRTVCLHEQRLVFGGTKRRPSSFYGSTVDDFENSRYTSLPDAAFNFTISSNESNPIQWMVSQQKLLIGTAGDEWAVGSTNTDQAMGAGNVSARQQSSFGSTFLQAEVVNEVVLFSQRQAKKLRELTFNFEKDGWVAPDLTILANHIAGAGFAETAFAQQPDAIFWTITAGGHLVGMTYERDQNVVGWHRHSTVGSFESVATIYGGNDPDEIWFCCNRIINGQNAFYIERFDPNFRINFEEEDKVNYWYLDAAKRTVSPTEITEITGLEHLEGMTVGVLGDGANQPTRVVTAGKITIQEPAKVVLVGLPYTSVVKPMNINIPAQDGTSQGRKVRIHRMVVRFYKSLTCQFSSDDETWDEIFFRDRDDLMDTPPSVFTGDREVATGTNFRTTMQMALRQNRPFPLAVLALILWADYYGE